MLTYPIRWTPNSKVEGTTDISDENSHTKSKNISFQLKKSGYTQKSKTKLKNQN